MLTHLVWPNGDHWRADDEPAAVQAPSPDEEEDTLPESPHQATIARRANRRIAA